MPTHAFLLLGMLVPQADDTVHVLATTINIRDSASAKAGLVGVANIGTVCTRLESGNGWLRVKCGAVEGWAKQDNLGVNPPDRNVLLQDARDARHSLADRLTWATRAGALAPDDVENHALVKELFLAAEIERTRTIVGGGEGGRIPAAWVACPASEACVLKSVFGDDAAGTLLKVSDGFFSAVRLLPGGALEVRNGLVEANRVNVATSYATDEPAEIVVTSLFGRAARVSRAWKGLQVQQRYSAGGYVAALRPVGDYVVVSARDRLMVLDGVNEKAVAETSTAGRRVQLGSAGSVVVLTARDNVTALDAATLKEKWTRTAPAELDFRGEEGGTLYFTSPAGTFAWGASDGADRWSAPGAAYDVLLGTGAVLVVARKNAQLRSRENGALLAEMPADWHAASYPFQASAERISVVVKKELSAGPKELMTFALADGAVRRFPVEDETYEATAHGSGVLVMRPLPRVLGQGEARVMFTDPEGKTARWSSSSSWTLFGETNRTGRALSPVGGQVIACSGGSVVVLDSETGQVVGVTGSSRCAKGVAMTANQTVWVTEHDAVTALRPSGVPISAEVTGVVRVNRKALDGVPVVVGDRLVFTDRKGRYRATVKTAGPIAVRSEVSSEQFSSSGRADQLVTAVPGKVTEVNLSITLQRPPAPCAH